MKFQDLASLLASKQQEDEMMSVGGNADINQIAPPPEMPRQKSPDEMLLERLSTPDIQQIQSCVFINCLTVIYFIKICTNHTSFMYH